jgi:hypothetical protein
MGLEWTGHEKFNRYIEWLELIIEMCFDEFEVRVQGKIAYLGDNGLKDIGTISVSNNKVTVEKGIVDMNTVTREAAKP